MSIAKHITYERTKQGTDIYLLPTQLRDIVIAHIALPGGIHRTGNTEALAMLLSGMMPSGTRGMSRNAVRERIEDLGAQVSVHEGSEHLFLKVIARKKVFGEVLDLLLQVVIAPRFNTREYTETLTRLDTALLNDQEDTHAQAAVARSHALYRRGHPHWILPPEEARAQLKQVSLDEVRAFHHKTLSAVGAVVVVCGDIAVSTLRTMLEDLCAQLPAERPSRVVDVHIDKTRAPDTADIVIPMADKMNVDTLLAVPLSITRDHDDYHPLATGVYTLGGSPTSRLFMSLRNRQSLTYGAYASLGGLENGYPGYLSARAIFPHNVFLRGRDALRIEVAKWTEKGITARELDACKEELAGKHKVGLSTTSGRASALLGTILNGKTPDHLDEYPNTIQALTRAEVNRAIKEHVSYDLAITAAAGSVSPDGTPLAA